MSTKASVTSVLVDQREPSSIPDALHAKFAGIPLSITLLQVGDVWLATSDGSMLVVERKTPSDLLSSLRDGRLFAQASEMRGVSPWAYLVITGMLQCGSDGKVWYGREATGWNWDAVQGALLSVQEAGIGVIQCQEGTFADACGRLAARSREVVRVPPARDMQVLTHGEQVLAALPGIGSERIGALLDYCGTPAWALAWLTDGDNVQRVPGVGPQTKLNVRKALGLAEGCELQVVAKDIHETGM